MISPEAQIAAIAALSAIGGTLVGGVVTYFSTRALKNQEWKQEQFSRDIARREELYADFLAECARLLIVQQKGKLSNFDELNQHYMFIARIRLVASEEVNRATVAVSKALKNRFTLEDQPTNDFYEAKESYCDTCRRELDALRSKRF